MEFLIEIVQLLVYGIIEGFTEWLPISSTGHLLLLEKLWPLPFTADMQSFFRVAIQLAAMLAVLFFFWNELWPLRHSTLPDRPHLYWDQTILLLWAKLLLACLPAAIVGLLFNDVLEELFYKPLTIAIALITVGLLFLLAEFALRGQTPRVESLQDISWLSALLIGLAQVLAAIFPGVSRSGACILAALLLAVGRPTAASFSFFLGIPVMGGASLLYLLKLDALPDTEALLALLLASLAAFLTAFLSLRLLMNFVRQHSFNVFAWYRIALGLLVLFVLVLLPLLSGSPRPAPASG